MGRLMLHTSKGTDGRVAGWDGSDDVRGCCRIFLRRRIPCPERPRELGMFNFRLELRAMIQRQVVCLLWLPRSEHSTVFSARGMGFQIPGGTAIAGRSRI
jgi:hypothetical protein